MKGGMSLLYVTKVISLRDVILMNKIEISMPDIFLLRPFTVKVLELKKEHPEYFYDDVEVTSVYGSWPTIWMGGRFVEGSSKIDEVGEVVKYFNERHISVRYTFTNLFLEQKHLKDRVGNQILKITEQNQTMRNDVNTASETLREYLKKEYPSFNVVYSTTMRLSDVDEINKLSETDLVVPDYTINKDFEKLAKLKHPENIELLANDDCIDNCPYRTKHYENISKYNLYLTSDFMVCQIKTDKTNPKNNITIDEIREKYLPLGINKFKIIGRGSDPITLVNGILNYLVRPEFREKVSDELRKV